MQSPERPETPQGEEIYRKQLAGAIFTSIYCLVHAALTPKEQAEARSSSRQQEKLYGIQFDAQHPDIQVSGALSNYPMIGIRLLLYLPSVAAIETSPEYCALQLDCMEGAPYSCVEYMISNTNPPEVRKTVEFSPLPGESPFGTEYRSADEVAWENSLRHPDISCDELEAVLRLLGSAASM